MKATWPRCGWIVLSLVMIAGVGLVVYQLSLKIGFWTDDYSFIDTAGRLNFVDYWISYLDPRLQWHWYRPMQGLFWWIGYTLFRGDATGYHAMQLGLHLANALLFFNLATRITHHWRLGLVAGLIYVTLPTMNLAVLWVGVADPLVSLFYLLTINFWILYLERDKRSHFALTLVAFIAALMSKEIAATLPATLFLADRWLIGKPLGLVQAAKRYVVFVVLLFVYSLIELNVLTRGVFTTSLGYGVGGHILSSLIQHATTLAFPWQSDSLMEYLSLFAVLAAVGLAAFKRERRVLFLIAATVLTVFPVLPFPANIASAPRYLYLPLMGSAVGIALLVEFVRFFVGFVLRNAGLGMTARNWGMAIGVALLIVWQGTLIAEAAINFEGTVRQSRLQFRPIFQNYTAFQPDTLLYFIDPPLESPYISGMFFLRYGRDVIIDANDRGTAVRLRDHASAFIFYQDDDRNWHSQAVEPNVSAGTAPSVPARFGSSISLAALDIARTHLQPGEPVILLASWRPLQQMTQDYTVFVHLVDQNGKQFAGQDTPPRQGTAHTNEWRANELVVDGIIIPTDANILPGDYAIEIGLYDPATMQRLSVLDATGQPITDKFVIVPIIVGDQGAR